MTKRGKRWAQVVRDGVVLFQGTTVRRAEKFIADMEAEDEAGVKAGKYTIDASTAADAEYQRIRRRK